MELFKFLSIGVIWCLQFSSKQPPETAAGGGLQILTKAKKEKNQMPLVMSSLSDCGCIQSAL